MFLLVLVLTLRALKTKRQDDQRLIIAFKNLTLHIQLTIIGIMVLMLAQSKTSCIAEIAMHLPQLELCSRQCQLLTPSRLSFTPCNRSLLARRHTGTMAVMVGIADGHLSTCKLTRSFMLLSIISTKTLKWEMSPRVQFQAHQISLHRLCLLHMWL
jgi:hypothetical protein